MREIPSFCFGLLCETNRRAVTKTKIEYYPNESLLVTPICVCRTFYNIFQNWYFRGLSKLFFHRISKIHSLSQSKPTLTSTLTNSDVDILKIQTATSTPISIFWYILFILYVACAASLLSLLFYIIYVYYIYIY